MMEPSALSQHLEGIRYLTPDALKWINKRLILAQTPAEPLGVLSEELLHSSQARPATHRYYEQTNDMFCLAAVLMESLIKNHCFANANKRTAAAAGYIFLLLNGYELTAPSDEFVDIMVGIATHEYDVVDLENWLAHWSRDFNASELDGPNEYMEMFGHLTASEAC